MNALPTFTALGSGATVLMLHGIGGGHLAFAPQVESLAGAGYRAIAWDMPGYGHSAPIEPYTFKGLAQSCVDLIDALQCDCVTLVGHSMGGMVAQEVIARRPDKVSRLVLAGTSAAFGKRTDGRDADAWARQFVAQRTAPLDAGKSMAEVAQVLVPQMAGPGALPEGLRLAEHCMGGVPAATYRRALDCLVTFDRQAALRDIRVPTLLIGGEFDRVAAPSVMKQMAEAIPNARYAELKGIGHLMNLEAPEDFDGLLLDFLAEPAPSPASDLH
ncbi:MULTISPECIES: alpha/beta fold hydrolase [Hydrogenophaga]|jgi:3-oxoadipate enol-lactonase|uniref:Beta-ketoadipate enol-lactone hydrolase n=1 Tax=Hydrogenophaga intermedia TaxID=65786 RepID=A0A1L1PUL0_HYDIT|nr:MULTISPECIES: alpha/beta hydrolase [Hydrogenophaga]AOS81464.1 alpha/beta hydrolase [Hydrogenophaga sp. PBC]TMU72132.1 alpha/beta hydrolase [Hydrogenophaga intermedia]CDN88331.1 Beta-ketoadipate enol-lactone hydrolase [Hydrogenophaga intermedia]